MRFITKFGLALVLPAFAPTEPFPPLATVTYSGEAHSSAASFLGLTSFYCTVSSITDGDTLRCVERGPDGREIRVRLSGIDARERDGTCARGHPCAAASPAAATTRLEQLAGHDVLSCQTVSSTYGRIAAFCRNSSGIDLSCALLASGVVVKWDRYWGAHRC